MANIVHDRASLLIAGGGISGASAGVVSSSRNLQSMLNSSLYDIINGNFLWYGADIAFIVGTFFSVVGVGLTLYKLIKRI